MQARQRLYSWVTVPTCTCHSLQMYCLEPGGRSVGKIACSTSMSRSISSSSSIRINNQLLGCIYPLPGRWGQVAPSALLASRPHLFEFQANERSCLRAKRWAVAEDQPWRSYLVYVTTLENVLQKRESWVDFLQMLFRKAACSFISVAKVIWTSDFWQHWKHWSLFWYLHQMK